MGNGGDVRLNFILMFQGKIEAGIAQFGAAKGSKLGKGAIARNVIIISLGQSMGR